MYCLGADTTNGNLTLALVGEKISAGVVINIGKSGHSSVLMPAVDAFLKQNGVSVSDIDAVAVVTGPGSFTGIRIGVAAMTAIAFANNAKRIAVTAFELLAYNRQKATAAVDAGHGNLYIAECDGGRVLYATFAEGDEANRARANGGLVFEPICSASDALIGVIGQKLARGEYVSAFEPFYMRKSQAERERQ